MKGDDLLVGERMPAAFRAVLLVPARLKDMAIVRIVAVDELVHDALGPTVLPHPIPRRLGRGPFYRYTASDMPLWTGKLCSRLRGLAVCATAGAGVAQHTADDRRHQSLYLPMVQELERTEDRNIYHGLQPFRRSVSSWAHANDPGRCEGARSPWVD